MPAQEDISTNPRVTPDRARIEEAIDLYLDSDVTKAPVIIAGRGAVQANAKEAIEELAERTNALLATTLQARGYFSGHPFSLGFPGTWGHVTASEYLSRAEYVLAVGCSLNEHTTDGGRLVDGDTTVVHLDTEPANIGRYTPVDVGIVGDARVGVQELIDTLDETGIDVSGNHWTDSVRRELAQAAPWDEREFPAQDGTMDPRVVLRELNAMLPDDRLVVTDGGHCMTWVVTGIDVPHPDDQIWTIDFGSIGMGLFQGIGASHATDDRACITFCGDAGFMMALQELDTAVRRDVPLMVIVLNDGALGAEYHQLERAGKAADAARIDASRIAETAQAIGADAHTVRSLADLEALGSVVGRPPTGPVVINCLINSNVRHTFYDV